MGLGHSVRRMVTARLALLLSAIITSYSHLRRYLERTHIRLSRTRSMCTSLHIAPVTKTYRQFLCGDYFSAVVNVIR